MAWPFEPTVPVPSDVGELQLELLSQLLNVTEPVGPEVSLLALVSVTVAVKVTEVPEVEVFPGDDEARLVVVESVYWAPPEYTKWYWKFSQTVLVRAAVVQLDGHTG